MHALAWCRDDSISVLKWCVLYVGHVPFVSFTAYIEKAKRNKLGKKEGMNERKKKKSTSRNSIIHNATRECSNTVRVGELSCER